MSQDRHYPWDVLEIDETDNKKLIKKAYAVLIKQYKPDEYPEKFKEIQAAYKFALLLIYNVNKTLTNIEVTQWENAATNNEDELTTEENEIVTELLNNLKKMTFTKTKDKDNLNNWKFIETYYSLENLKLKDEIAREVFKNVAENNLFLMQVYKRLLINPKVLIYMNEVFDWTIKWQDYGNRFPKEYFIVTLDYIENKNGLGYFVLVEDFLDDLHSNLDKAAQNVINTIEVPIKRLWSLILDFLFALLVLLNIDSFEIVKTNMAIFYLSVFFGSRLILELITTKSISIGKFFMGLKVENIQSEAPFIKQLFIRHFIIFCYFTPLIAYSMVSSTYENIFLTIFIAVALINLIIFWIKKRFFHDVFSNTRIVKK